MDILAFGEILSGSIISVTCHTGVTYLSHTTHVTGPFRCHTVTPPLLRGVTCDGRPDTLTSPPMDGKKEIAEEIAARASFARAVVARPRLGDTHLFGVCSSSLCWWLMRGG